MKLKRKLLGTALALSIPFSQGVACTAISMVTPDDHVATGRTMEWGFNWDWSLMYVPQGTNQSITAPSDSNLPKINYSSKYSVLGTGLVRNAEDLFLDGQNSEGLSLSANYLPGFTEYQKVDSSDKNYASILEITTYILSEAATVTDAKEILSKTKVWSDKSTMVDGVSPQLHFLITDKAGKGIIVEYVDGKIKITPMDTKVKVMTNAPTIDWHLTNLRNYFNLSNHTIARIKLGDENTQNPKNQNPEDINALGQGNGLLGMPGDYSPPSRFIKTVALGYYSDLKGPKDESAVDKITHVLNNVDIPKGAVVETMGDQKMFDHTAYTVVKDQTDNKLYLRTYNKINSPVMIDLNNLDKSHSKAFSINMDDLKYPNNDITSTLK
jgi:choloylglycine hydrolase